MNNGYYVVKHITPEKEFNKVVTGVRKDVIRLEYDNVGEFVKFIDESDDVVLVIPRNLIISIEKIKR